MSNERATHLSTCKVLEGPDRRLAKVLDTSLYGQKIYGLSRLPAAWVPPYFIVSSEFLSSCRAASLRQRASLISSWANAITRAAQVQLKGEDELILRSSGNMEDIAARGRYYSLTMNVKMISKDLTAYVHKFLADASVRDDEVSLIIQAYRRPERIGHLSNERRCYRENRDWLGESSSPNKVDAESFQINIRNWRDGKRSPDPSKPLLCTMALNLIDVLKSPAYWATGEGYRLHFEWVWDGKFVWLVQGDVDESGKVGEDPTQQHIRTLSATTFPFSHLESISAKSHKNYSKIENALIYRKLGLPSSRLWVLSDPEIIQDLARGRLKKSFKEDIEALSVAPVIVRCDIKSKDLKLRQMLPRTDEKNSSDEIVEWLKSTAKAFQKERLSRYSPVFIFHHFIPAQASAFVYAEPNHREVLVEALWGLPEGLYYNAHDKYIVDTGSADLSEVVKKGEQGINFEEQLSYKPYFIIPDDEGRWVSRRLRQPFDWKASIQPPDLIKDIAICARQICEYVGKSISVMWFIGVSEKGINAAHMPWHHEEASIAQLRNRETGVRRKTLFDREFVIRTEDDLILARQADHSSVKIARLKIRPEEDRLLRNKQLLRDVGELSKQLGAPILLDGGVLSHAYYQLMATGATVDISHPFDWKGTSQEFYKLVRDKVPGMIERFGEKVRLARVSKEGRLVALKYKLLEEVFEFLDANNRDETIGELCDLEEVVAQILTELNVTTQTLSAERAKKNNKRGAFREGLILLETSLPMGTASFENSTQELIKNDYTTPVMLSEERYLSLASEVVVRGDQRFSDFRRETLRQAWIPMAAINWEGETRPILTRIDGDSVVGKVTVWREGSRLRVDLRVEVVDRKAEQPSLL